MTMIFKCKICGGDLENTAQDIAVCQYCGTKQILPKMTSERKVNLYDRANHYRNINEFDKAFGIYEQIVAEDSTDAEVYWDLVLCRYGVEYVEDPRTKRRIPTVNRTQYQAIYEDVNYKAAVQHASAEQKEVIEADAAIIDKIQKDILSISSKEQPYDIFICYKETDEQGRRTPDSVIAQDMYNELTKEGYKVFFSRITLEDKLGTAYEPYIFAALNSAKVLIAVGSRPEYYNAVWVKNEWSRYLGLINAGEKKVLIPAYKDMDPYDLPEEFSHLQAQDMGKLGFMQDLIRGIGKIVDTKTTVQKQFGGIDVDAYKKRIKVFLEDGEYMSACDYCNKVLDIQPDDGETYLLKLCAEMSVGSIEDLSHVARDFGDMSSFRNAIKYCDSDKKSALEKAKESAANNAKRKKHKVRLTVTAVSALLLAAIAIAVVPNYIIPKVKYNNANKLLSSGNYDDAYSAFQEIRTFGNSEEMIREVLYQEADYFYANGQYDKAVETWESLGSYADSNAKIQEALNESKYQSAISLMEQKEYEKATEIFKSLGSYSDSATYITECAYREACDLFDEEVYFSAKVKFQALGNYKDSKTKVNECRKKLNKVIKHL